MVRKKPVLLVVLDGFGHAPAGLYNAITLAHTPFLDYLTNTYPHTLLEASGNAVGLPDGFIGNSEVGHFTLGAGRVVEQPLATINRALHNNSFFANQLLTTALHKLAQQQKPLHIMGLLSDAGVHSSINHLFAYLQAARTAGVTDVYLHLFLDGRDVAPQSATQFLQQLEEFIKKLGLGTIASLHGRWYAMDRNNNTERTQQSYNALTTVRTERYTNWRELLTTNYDRGIYDELIPPTPLKSFVPIASGDGLICINYRADRMRQLASYFTHPAQHPTPAFFITPYSYGQQTPTTALFSHTAVHNTLKDVLAQHKKTIFSIAETEKYAHVTYFFNGEQEEAVAGEERVMIPSIKAANYIELPCMSAYAITKTVADALHNQRHDFYLINYANADMVGHSGNSASTIQAIQCLDNNLAALYDVAVKKYNATLIITADHGKAEVMWDTATNQPNTKHTTNKVPVMVVNSEPTSLHSLHGLADVAPYILRLMGLPVPPEMVRHND